MKKRFWTLTTLLCATILATAGDAPKGKAHPQDVIQPAESIKWEDGLAKGTHIAKLWGDMNKGGSYGVLVKFDAGVTHPLHWHTHSLKLIVISGTFVHTPEDGKETRLGPGSYLLQAGKAKHISGSSADGPCEFVMMGSGKFDMMMAEREEK